MSSAPFNVIALAASAGGLKALTEVLTGLPAEVPAALVLVQHLDRRHPSAMAAILNRRTAIGVKEAQNGEQITPGVAYVAPPDHHLLINRGGLVSLTQTELVHFLRPSADLLLESVAASFRERAIAVILSGTGSDGSMGVKAIKKMGGTVIVQKPGTSEFRGMPDAALQTGQADFVLELEEIAPALVALLKDRRAA